MNELEEQGVEIKIDTLACQLNIPLPEGKKEKFQSNFIYFVTENFFNNHLLEGLNLPLKKYNEDEIENYVEVQFGFAHDKPLLYDAYSSYLGGFFFIDFINSLKLNKYGEPLTEDEARIISYSIKPLYQVINENEKNEIQGIIQ